MRALLFAAFLLRAPGAFADLAKPNLAEADAALAREPASGKRHLERGEALADLGRSMDAAQEAQKAFWLDPSLKPQADALLARVGGGKGDPFGGRSRDSWGRWAFLAAATLGILAFLGRIVRLDR